MADLESQITDVEADIKALNQEVENLKTDKALLIKQIKKLEDGEPITGTNDVPILQHKYFNEVILEFFPHRPQLVQEEENLDLSQNGSKQVESVTKKRKLNTSHVDMALLENIYRFSGVTAFPLNQYLFHEEDTLLGLRFDIYNIDTFNTPHYVIIRKEQVKDTDSSTVWKIFKHTIPVFVPIRQFEEEYLSSTNNLIGFVKAMKLYFMRLQYRHEKFSQLEKGFGYKVEKDLQCRRVVIEKQNELTIVLINSDVCIEEIEIPQNKYGSEYEQQVRSILQNCEFKDLFKAFRSIVK